MDINPGHHSQREKSKHMKLTETLNVYDDNTEALSSNLIVVCMDDKFWHKHPQIYLSSLSLLPTPSRHLLFTDRELADSDTDQPAGIGYLCRLLIHA